MAKTVTPGTVELEHGSFEANAMPDVFDARDLEYRPRLQPLGRNVRGTERVPVGGIGSARATAREARLNEHKPSAVAKCVASGGPKLAPSPPGDNDPSCHPSRPGSR